MTKIIINNNNCCPPHYLPHKMPFGLKIVDEKCHFHKYKLSMFHHIFYCRQILKCPHVESMLEENKKGSFYE